MIEPATSDTLPEILPLIREYQTFYQVEDICDDRNHVFFSQFGSDNPAGCQFLYRHEGQVVAFTTVYFTFTSTIAAKVATLNDVYTLPEYRGQGIARQLIDHCRDFAIESGAKRLQWVTAPDNKTAQSLYDSMDTSKSTWHFYTYS
ncbi:Uncharacterised protein [BD1-7 clade bacterium]|uniref:N-acetyltransferase domain-containing protein n=1 Tax=BD1-7 clade bacterium TaxID=2029982 RepID=A0A5S9PQA3_9GAMM|nr:Uncharacterised protein [BD1-7 clade bacterium]